MVQTRSHGIARGHESLYLKHVEPAALAKTSCDLQSFVFIIGQRNGLSLVNKDTLTRLKNGRMRENLR